MEGRHCFNAASPTDPSETCPAETGLTHRVEGDPLVVPVIEARNAGYFEDGLGVAVGGNVYRGATLPRLLGKYLFGMFSRGRQQGGMQPGRIFVATREGAEDWPFEELPIANRPGNELDGLLLSFGQDQEYEALTARSTASGASAPSGDDGSHPYTLRVPRTSS